MAIYCGECLRIITENTAKMGGGSYIKIKLQDILEPKKADNRKGEEIVTDFILNSGLKVK